MKVLKSNRQYDAEEKHSFERNQTDHTNFYLDSLANSQIEGRRLQRATPVSAASKTAGPAVIFDDDPVVGSSLQVYTIPELDGASQLTGDDVHFITSDLERSKANLIDDLIVNSTMYLSSRVPRTGKYQLLLVAHDLMTSSFFLSTSFRLYSKKSQIEDKESLRQREFSRKKRKSL
ncbi:hypothetical protein PROFUN_06377 [Planoprotostelium fungivorum]|uniref:Velvet domain-containing protein n=1 Tax=Planoprotostelium fungivorum TaxID=1890364 RepID=A0A2P6NNW8_9EUKA|nr:hypothetical protein PROFUN_06377 [Planoprotostelium fungivorum]